jgi:hypothetical protein
MSTKTTFKRIALVAVAALGFGLVSAVPSIAAVQSDSLVSASTTATGTVETASTNVITLSFLDDNSGADTMTATVALISSPVTSTRLVSVSETDAQNTANPAGASATSTVFSLASAGAGRVTASATVSLTPDVVGTYVVRITPAGGFTTTAQTWTVTVAAKPTITAAGSTVYKGYDYYEDETNVALRGTWAAPSEVTDALTLNCFAGPGFGCARIKVSQGNGSTASPMSATDSVAITATVTGPGLVEINSIYPAYTVQPKGTYAVETSAQNTAYGLTKYVYVWSTGVPGSVSVVIKAGDIVLGTKTVNFYESEKTYTVATAATFTGSNYAVGANTGALTVTAKDALGNVVPNATVYAYSATVATATIAASAVTSASGVATFALQGVASGSSVISFGNAATLAASTITATTTVAVTKSTAKTVTMTLDKTEYAPGEKVVVTITAVDANGAKVADGPRAVIAGIASNLALTGGATLSNTTTLLGGSVTQTIYAPATPGAFIITATEGADTDSTTKATLTATAAIINVAAEIAQAAADASAEAIDAANAATDAANAAAEAADAATAAAQDSADAVAALSVQVSEQIAELKAQNDALRKQLIALTNLIIKIQKKVKA